MTSGCKHDAVGHDLPSEGRQVPNLEDILGCVQQVRYATGDEVVLFLLNFPVQNIASWYSKLTRR